MSLSRACEQPFQLSCACIRRPLGFGTSPSGPVAFCRRVDISCIMHQEVAYRGVCASYRSGAVSLACWEMGRRIWEQEDVDQHLGLAA